jgi:predicted glycosyltransferase
MNSGKFVWIDLENSPHVPFFKPIIKELEQKGYKVKITARDCFQVCELAKLHKLRYKRIGHHYGKSRILKLLGLLIRTVQLVPDIASSKPAIALSHGSRAQVLSAKLLGIDTVIIGDYEHSHNVPFIKPSWLIVPEVISANRIWYDKGLFKYPGIKEDVYVPFFKPESKILKELDIPQDEILVTIRPPATEAHYHRKESEILFYTAMDFLCQASRVRCVVLPRNEIQAILIRKKWRSFFENRKLIIPKKVVKGLNLIWHSDLVVSGGGTMNREAAALHVPAYSIFRGKIGAVDQYLMKNGRLILVEKGEDVANKIKLQKRQNATAIDCSNHRVLDAIVVSLTKVMENGN